MDFWQNKEILLTGGASFLGSHIVELIADLTGFDGDIIWDASKPNGQPRRCLDVSKAKKEFGFETEIDFREGLKKTIEGYLKNG